MNIEFRGRKRDGEKQKREEREQQKERILNIEREGQSGTKRERGILQNTPDHTEI